MRFTIFFSIRNIRIRSTCTSIMIMLFLILTFITTISRKTMCFNRSMGISGFYICATPTNVVSFILVSIMRLTIILSIRNLRVRSTRTCYMSMFFLISTLGARVFRKSMRLRTRCSYSLLNKNSTTAKLISFIFVHNMSFRRIRLIPFPIIRTTLCSNMLMFSPCQRLHTPRQQKTNQQQNRDNPALFHAITSSTRF